MPINTLDDYMLAPKQTVTINKTNTTVALANTPYSMFTRAGMPPAGVLPMTNKTAGLVPVASDLGYPDILPFAAGAKGYVTGVDFVNNCASRLFIYDRVYITGTFEFNDNIALSGQPSFSGRLPGGDYKNCQLWWETVEDFTDIPTVTVGYSNHKQQSGRTSGAFMLPAAMGQRRCAQIPLQAGDEGVSRVNSVTVTGATSGRFNLMILRPIWEGRITLAGIGDTHEFLKTGFVEVFQDSALYFIVIPDSTSSGTPCVELEVANK